MIGISHIGYQFKNVFIYKDRHLEDERKAFNTSTAITYYLAGRRVNVIDLGQYDQKLNANLDILTTLISTSLKKKTPSIWNRKDWESEVGTGSQNWFNQKRINYEIY